MKIGLVCQHFEPDRGGLERYTWNLSKELSKRGHEIHVFARTIASNTSGLQIHRVISFPFSSPAKNLSFAFMASKKASKYQLDILQSMERIWTQDIFRASDGINPVQIEQKYPNLFLRKIKALGPRRQVLSLLERRIFLNNGARFILTNSNLVKNQILTHYNAPKEKIRVIYNSVDTDRFNPRGRSQCRQLVFESYGIPVDAKLLLFSGNDFQLKGLRLLIESMALIKNKNLKLIVAGNDQAKKYQKLSQHYGIADDIFFIGYCRKPEILYRSADLFVLPTRYDAFANVCLEAMACATPVITTINNGSSELIRNGIHGYVLNSMQPMELALRIQEFFDRPGIQMGKAAAEQAATFSINRHIENIMSLYDELFCLRADKPIYSNYNAF